MNNFEIKKFVAAPVFFTDRKKIPDLTATVKNLPKKSAIIIREYDLDQKSRHAFAQQISTLAKPFGHKILIGKDIFLAKTLHADGLHFSDLSAIPLQFLHKKSWPKNFIFSVSCHNLRSLLKLQKLQPNWIFVAPVFATTSHPKTKNLGLINLAKIAFKSKKRSYFKSNIYALGGVNQHNLNSLKKLPVAGFGAIDFFSKIIP